MRHPFAASLSFAFLCLLSQGPVEAAIITTTDPGVGTEIGSRLRWGGSGFEASIFDNGPPGQNPTLNPAGSPAWTVGAAHRFSVSFDPTTGTLSLSVDFNRSDSFGAGESISRSLFDGSKTSYAGKGFNFISISGNESGSTGRSTITDLVINGDAQSSLAPGGGFVETFFKDSSGTAIAPISITGNLTFTTSGTSQERPSWNINFRGPGTPVGVVPEPPAIVLSSLGGVIGLGYGWLRLKRAAA